MVLQDRLRIDGKRVIVTGAGRGLGRAMALALADAGADIVCAARTQAQIDQTAEDVIERGRRALAIATDVTDPAQVNALVRRTAETWGGVDVLIANAGGGTTRGDVAEIDDASWQDTIALNLSSVFYCVRAVVPQFRAQGGGVIITVASATARGGDARFLAYSSAKAAVVTLTRGLAVQLAKDNVRANCIVPGFVLQETLHNADAIRATRGRAEFLAVRRAGEAWELGPLALLLASDASSYMTGEAFVIDGGALADGYAPSGWDVATDGGATHG